MACPTKHNLGLSVTGRMWDGRVLPPFVQKPDGPLSIFVISHFAISTCCVFPRPSVGCGLSEGSELLPLALDFHFPLLCRLDFPPSWCFREVGAYYIDK